MRAVELRGGRLRFGDDYRASADEGEVTVDVIQAGICETDLQLVAGYMGFSGVLGHEFVGIAKSGPFSGRRVVGEINCVCHRCPTCLAGRPNHCPHRSVLGILNRDGAFAEQVSLPQENLHAVPDGISDDQATLIEPLAAAFQIPAQVDLSRHPNVVIIGDGRLGYLCAQVLALHGCRVTVVGKHAKKLKRFADLGIRTTTLDVEPKTGSMDLAVDCCGHTSGIPTAFQWLRPRGTLVLKTTVASEHTLSLSPIVIDEITVVGSRCGPFDVAIKALASGRIEVDSLVTSRFALEEADRAFEAAKSGSHLKVILDVTAST